MVKHNVDTCFESLNGLLHELIGYDQHADWMMKPMSSLDWALSEALPILALISQLIFWIFLHHSVDISESSWLLHFFIESDGYWRCYMFCVRGGTGWDPGVPPIGWSKRFPIVEGTSWLSKGYGLQSISKFAGVSPKSLTLWWTFHSLTMRWESLTKDQKLIWVRKGNGVTVWCPGRSPPSRRGTSL